MQAILFFGGTVLLVLGAFMGFPYWRALSRGRESAHAWRVAHNAITAGAVGIIAIAAGFQLLKLPAWGELALVLGALTSGYGFAIGSTLSALTGRRGLNARAGGMNGVVLFFNIVGALGSVFAGPFLVYGAYMNLLGQ